MATQQMDYPSDRRRRWNVLLAVLAVVVCPGFALAQEKRPNIVVIMADDMGYSDIGCFGGEVKTPNIDALAAGGLRFTNFYNTARCCPTRAALLTGLYSHQAGVGHMTENKKLPGYQGELHRNCVTIAEVLRRSGYGCYMVGKWQTCGRLAVQPIVTVGQLAADRATPSLAARCRKSFGAWVQCNSVHSRRF